MKLTLTIPKNKVHIRQFIDKEIDASSKIKETGLKDGVLKGLNKIKNKLKSGCAYLYDSETDELEIFDYPLDDFYYRWGKDYYVPSANQQIIDGRTYLLVTLDTKEATIGEIRGKSINCLWHDRSEIEGKHNKGGQSKARFQRAREESKKEWFKKIADKINEIAFERYK